MKGPLARPDLSWALVLATLLVGCRESTVLHVALYPYLPDAASDDFRGLLARIESEFEGQHPEVDVRLAPLDPNSGAFYDFDSLRMMLSAKPGAGGFDLVEVDAALLGELIDSQLVRAWPVGPPGRSDWHPAALQAVTVGDSSYGIPHWLCGHFVFSRERAIVEASSAQELAAALSKATPGTPGVAAKFAGNWDLTALYLDAWVDTYGGVASEAMLPPRDSVVIESLLAVARECRVGGSNPCLEGGSLGGSAEAAAEAFAGGQVDAFIGFSEHLHPMLRRAGRDPTIKLALAPLGTGNRPIVFVDALVLRRNCHRACAAAARAFATHLNQPETHAWITMAQDAGPRAIPRYLMPATLSAYRQPALAADPYYPRILSAVEGAIPFPIRGIVSNWEAARLRLDSLLAR